MQDSGLLHITTIYPSKAPWKALNTYVTPPTAATGPLAFIPFLKWAQLLHPSRPRAGPKLQLVLHRYQESLRAQICSDQSSLFDQSDLNPLCFLWLSWNQWSAAFQSWLPPKPEFFLPSSLPSLFLLFNIYGYLSPTEMFLLLLFLLTIKILSICNSCRILYIISSSSAQFLASVHFNF